MTVLQIDNEKVRQLIETYTEERCKPDVIKFVQDGGGNWITAVENFSNVRFVSKNQKSKLQAFLTVNKEEATDNITELIAKYGVEIEYIPKIEPEI